MISSGDVQWMAAGGGIIHPEMLRGDRKARVFGFQRWSNLPRREKMREPRYREVKAGQIPLVRTEGGAAVRVIADEESGVRGPVRDIASEPIFLDVSLPAGGRFERRPVRFLWICGCPLREPVAWHGPIVMNRREELEAAFGELREGTFVRREGHGRV